MNAVELFKSWADGASFFGLLAVLMGWVPHATAVLTLIYIGVRLWETDTVKQLTGRPVNHSRRKEDEHND